jgi:hypothetical protein
MKWILGYVYITNLIILSIFFFKRYKKYKITELFYMGLTFVSIAFSTSIPWNLGYLFYITTSIPLNDNIIFLIWATHPLQLIFWIIVFIKLVVKKKLYKNLIIGFTFTIIIVIEISYLILLILSPTNIGTTVKGLYTTFTDFGTFFSFFPYTIMFITGLWFSTKFYREEKLIFKIRGKLFIIAIFIGILSILGAFIRDFYFIFGSIGFIIMTIINTLLRCLFPFFTYIGFALPELVKNRFLKEEYLNKDNIYKK